MPYMNRTDLESRGVSRGGIMFDKAGHSPFDVEWVHRKNLANVASKPHWVLMVHYPLEALGGDSRI